MRGVCRGVWNHIIFQKTFSFFLKNKSSYFPLVQGLGLPTSTAEAKIPTCSAFYKLEQLLHSVCCFLTNFVKTGHFLKWVLRAPGAAGWVVVEAGCSLTAFCVPRWRLEDGVRACANPCARVRPSAYAHVQPEHPRAHHRACARKSPPTKCVSSGGKDEAWLLLTFTWIWWRLCQGLLCV